MVQVFAAFLESVGASDIRTFEEGQLKDMQEQHKARMKIRQHTANLEVCSLRFARVKICASVSCLYGINGIISIVVKDARGFLFLARRFYLGKPYGCPVRGSRYDSETF